MMNNEQLTDYKQGLEKELKEMEFGCERVKLDILAKKKMIQLIDSQIKNLEPSNFVERVKTS